MYNRIKKKCRTENQLVKLESLYQHTKVAPAPFLEKEGSATSFFIKMDCDQPSGSFKIRGMENLCRSYLAKGKQHFVASSGGNAGYSLAYVARELGAKVQVVLPQSTPAFMQEKIQYLGAKVTVFGKAWDEADQEARRIAEAEGWVYVSPFDDPLLWEGHASIITEDAGRYPKPDAIVVSVGGGGLLTGVLQGLESLSWEDIPVFAIETEGAASFYQSWHAKQLIRLDTIRSKAGSLGAKTVSAKGFAFAQRFALQPRLVSDAQAAEGMKAFQEQFHQSVELACGAAIGYPLAHPEDFAAYTRVLVIGCGGVVF